ncbi:hypothetical protein Asp14428_65460 [Actinoplanes sp. NBRC 14428]|nr:hypothetical protein Asp14428_65460 [Actinoplanes sp. NBRC 14428]
MREVRDELGVDIPAEKIVLASAERWSMLRASWILLLASLGFRRAAQRLIKQEKIHRPDGTKQDMPPANAADG